MIRVFKTLIIIVIYFNFNIQQFNIINVFTNVIIDELIYVWFLDSFHILDYCLKLFKVLYELLWSPLLWYNDLTKALKNLKLHLILESSYLFTNDKLIVFFYVNDIMMLYHLKHHMIYDEFRSELLKAYNIREIDDLKWFLRIQVIHDRT